MATQVEASTIQAGQLFSTNHFRIPNFQRDYSWKAGEEALEFWWDLREAMTRPPYFLGLLIFTEEDAAKTVVDGQQRLLTLSLLANSIRKAALRRGRRLVADSMRDVFLFGLNFETEKRAPRILLTSERDRASFEALLEEGVDEQTAPRSNIEKVQRFLDREIERDLTNQDPSWLGKWAQFLTTGITFALFEHPDRNAAYKVYEIVNTRGRDLTPAELIKSYVIGVFSNGRGENIHRRWAELERPFADLNAASQFTQFIRHVVTLTHGYVIPRDLYQEITLRYRGEAGVIQLFDELEAHLSLYLQMIDPAVDIEQDDDVARSFAILDAISLTTVRPIFLAVCRSQNRGAGLAKLVRIVVSRIVAGPFGTGSIERRFGEAARVISQTGRWEQELEKLKDLAPTRADFERQAAGQQNKGVLAVLRNSLLQGTVLPPLTGHLHAVRPANAVTWPEFEEVDYKELGSTIGNMFLSKEERRPRGTNTLSGALGILLPTAISAETDFVRMATSWRAEDVMEVNRVLARQIADIWYA